MLEEHLPQVRVGRFTRPKKTRHDVGGGCEIVLQAARDGTADLLQEGCPILDSEYRHVKNRQLRRIDVKAQGRQRDFRGHDGTRETAGREEWPECTHEKQQGHHGDSASEVEEPALDTNSLPEVMDPYHRV